MKDVFEESQSGFDIGFGESSSPAVKDFTPDDLCVLKTMFLELEKAIDAINISPEGSTYPGSFIFDLLGKAEVSQFLWSLLPNCILILINNVSMNVYLFILLFIVQLFIYLVKE